MAVSIAQRERIEKSYEEFITNYFNNDEMRNNEKLISFINKNNIDMSEIRTSWETNKLINNDILAYIQAGENYEFANSIDTWKAMLELPINESEAINIKENATKIYLQSDKTKNISYYEAYDIKDIELKSKENVRERLKKIQEEKIKNGIDPDDLSNYTKIIYGISYQPRSRETGESYKSNYEIRINRLENNIKALETIKLIESEKRKATDKEKEILKNYTGFGGMIKVFEENNETFEKYRNKLKEILTESEYKTMSESTGTAFFTPKKIIKGMYNAIEKMGFTENERFNEILEPSCGRGSFFEEMPAKLRKNANITGIEIDEISAKISKYINDDINIKCTGFEKSGLENNKYDLVMTNVPFGTITLIDEEHPEYSKHLIHDFFFLKGLDKAKPNGVVAFITSSSTMDKLNTDLRQELIKRAKLLGAVRIPNNQFYDVNCTITTDIIFLQKREQKIEKFDNIHDKEITNKEIAFLLTKEQEKRVNYNKYYLENPEQVCGKSVLSNTKHGMKVDCIESKDTGNFEVLYEKALQGIETNIKLPVETKRPSIKVNFPKKKMVLM